MSGVAVLLSAIIAASGPTDYPARIGMSEQALHEIANTRLTANPGLETVCTLLNDNVEGGTLGANLQGFTADDARVIGFFVGRNNMYSHIK